jgi:hypothetical protein
MYDMDVGYSLKNSTPSVIAYWNSSDIYIIEDFSQLSEIWGYVCDGNGMNVLSYAHPQLFNAMVEQERLEDDGIGDELMEMQEILWPIKRL